MCYYSLTGADMRDAKVGDALGVQMFQFGTKGLASPGDCETAVCMKSGTVLTMVGIPSAVQEKCGVGSKATAIFKQRETKGNWGESGDFFVFVNGKEIPLNYLVPESVQITVVALPLEVSVEDASTSVVDDALRGIERATEGVVEEVGVPWGV